MTDLAGLHPAGSVFLGFDDQTKDVDGRPAPAMSMRERRQLYSAAAWLTATAS
jgi:hypothetical protein